MLGIAALDPTYLLPDTPKRRCFTIPSPQPSPTRAEGVASGKHAHLSPLRYHPALNFFYRIPL